VTDWIVFVSVVAGALAVDFGVSRKSGERNAVLWSAVWIALSLAFGGWIALRHGGDAGITYLTAYLLEKSLSVDNLFVFILIFSLTGIPPALQPRVLFWGVFSALVMRAALIGVGVEVLERFHWMIYPLAGLLVYAAVRMLRGTEAQSRYIEKGCAVCTSWVARIVPIVPTLQGSRFLVRKEGQLMATPLLVALAMIESADLIFAVDSIPAVLAVTRDPFLVYSSNIFALLGLRSLYFLVGNAIRRLRFLRPGLAIMLLLAGAKLALGSAVEIPSLVSLAVIAVVFGAAIGASLLFPGEVKTASSGGTKPTCAHRNQIKNVAPKTKGCEECLKTGDQWVQLRVCLSCGHVGCCDSSKNRHATRHFQNSGHPVMQTMQPGESWKWCYVDRLTLE
jgi:tellurite resistance protein TerC